MKQIANFAKQASAVFALCAAVAVALPAQTFTTLVSFDGANGELPYASLVQSINGDLYGTTYAGGAHGGGTVFKMTSSGVLTGLYNFCAESGCTDGQNPGSALVEVSNGDFYGTTRGGGRNGYGTVFRLAPDGTLTTLYSFCSLSGCADGENPTAALLPLADGDLYGTTYFGGAHDGGTVFKITARGTLTTLYSFCAKEACGDGTNPEAALIEATGGDLYGTTVGGGASGNGTVFKMTQSGILTTLFSFCGDCASGSGPTAALVQASNGDLYGTAAEGGAYGVGTIFRITPGGALTGLYSFCAQSACKDGANPFGGLIAATDGHFYGTTYAEGPNGGGTIFKIGLTGALTTLYGFCAQSGCPDGANPAAGLVQDTNGVFYGTTSLLGGYGYGTVFSLSVGLAPFVETLPRFGRVGSAVDILGTDLASATSVTFNGTAATTFTVNSTGSAISTTVPAGATSGTVQVVTSSGTLLSNVPFRVLP